MSVNSLPKLRLPEGLAPRTSGALAIVILALSCSAPVDEGILATFDGGAVTAEELEANILALPPAARAVAPSERDGFYRELIRRLAVRDLLVARAEREGLATRPATAERLAEARRQLLVTTFMAREFAVAPPTEDELVARFEADPDRFTRPERREVFHLFLRPGQGESEAELRARLSALRDRAVGGEPFPLLAREHSQSQLRHGDGALGWVSPGQLPPRLNDIIFNLEQDVPSEILITRSGAHLFLATAVVEAQVPTFDEARGQLFQQLGNERQTEAVNRHLEAQPVPPDDFMPSVEELRALLSGGDGAAVVARVGDWTLTADELSERMSATQRGGGEAAVHGMVKALVQGQRLFGLAEAAGLAEEPAFDKKWRAAADSILVAEMERQALTERAAADTPALETFFAAERPRFAGPLRLRYERLAVPLGSDSGNTMEILERGLPALRDGRLELTSLAAEVGAAVEEPLWQSMADLRRGGPLRGRLAAVPVGGFSEPTSNGREIELFHVLERSEPDLPVLDSVRDEVVAAYLVAHGPRLYEEFIDEQLAEARFELLEEHVDLFAERATGLAATAD